MATQHARARDVLSRDRPARSRIRRLCRLNSKSHGPGSTRTWIHTRLSSAAEAGRSSRAGQGGWDARGQAIAAAGCAKLLRRDMPLSASQGRRPQAIGQRRVLDRAANPRRWPLEPRVPGPKRRVAFAAAHPGGPAPCWGTSVSRAWFNLRLLRAPKWAARGPGADTEPVAEEAGQRGCLSKLHQPRGVCAP